MVLASAARMRAAHSDPVKISSIIMAKWSLYSGRGGFVFVKSIFRMEAPFGGVGGRKYSGSLKGSEMAILVESVGFFSNA